MLFSALKDGKLCLVYAYLTKEGITKANSDLLNELKIGEETKRASRLRRIDDKPCANMRLEIKNAGNEH
jgi:hypothetical protein